MSQQPLEFDERVTGAVDCALERLEDADAVESWLQQRYSAEEKPGRVEEALAYLRQEVMADV